MVLRAKNVMHFWRPACVLAVVAAGILLHCWGGSLRGDALDPVPQSKSPDPLAIAASPTRPMPVAEGDPPKAVARFEGKPAPGMTLTLQSDGSRGTDLRVRWVQVEGHPVTLDDPTARAPRLIVPEGAGMLGFLLVVSSPLGSDTARLSIPVETRAPASPDPTVRADAGDDQVGLTGRQITLNGIRSEPRGSIGYRWIQVGGPTVGVQLSDGYIHTFVPPAPGVYRFALVVAAGSVISEPDIVSVSVGSPSLTSKLGAAAVTTEPLSEVARRSLAMVRGGHELAEPLAQAFEMAADRIDVYSSYDELHSELSRRLDLIIPEDSARRAIWIERLFTPLTSRLIEEMRSEGLDLRLPEARSAQFTQGQRAQFAELFRTMAEGFRASPEH